MKFKSKKRGFVYSCKFRSFPPWSSRVKEILKCYVDKSPEETKKMIFMCGLPSKLNDREKKELEEILEPEELRGALKYGAPPEIILDKTPPLGNFFDKIVTNHSNNFIQSMVRNPTSIKVETVKSGFLDDEKLMLAHGLKTNFMTNLELLKTAMIPTRKKHSTSRLITTNDLKIFSIKDKKILKYWWDQIIDGRLNCLKFDQAFNGITKEGFIVFGVRSKFGAKPRKRICMIIVKLHHANLTNDNEVSGLEIILLCTNEKFKRELNLSGVATTLIDFVWKELKDENGNLKYMLVYSDPKAVGFYENYGFVNENMMFGKNKEIGILKKKMLYPYTYQNKDGKDVYCPFLVYEPWDFFHHK